MPTDKKVETVAMLGEKLRRARLTIVADYRGLKVTDMQTLRGQLRPLGTEVRVAKNTLTAIAARQNGQAALEPALAGPTALILVYEEDLAGSSKVVNDFVRTSRIMTVRAGLLGTQLVTPEQVASLATLPPRAELQAQALGALVGPVTGLLGLFNSVASSLVSILDQQAEKLGGGGEAPPEVAATA
jgi:large subunit ribosomal protein L10